MERLTLSNNKIHTDIGIWILKNGNPKELISDDCDEYEYFKKLAEYEDLEEQGKLLKLPCKARDIVWDIDFGRPCSYEVTGFSFGSLDDDDWEEDRVLDQIVVYYTNSSGSITGTFAVSEIGKTIFLTRPEAEQALAETEGKK